jgi:hypothetical protein
MMPAAGASLSNQNLAFPKIGVPKPSQQESCVPPHGFWRGTISGRAARKARPLAIPFTAEVFDLRT